MRYEAKERAITNKIEENFLCYGTIGEFSKAVRKTYSYKENIPKLFKIEKILHDLRQGEMRVT